MEHLENKGITLLSPVITGTKPLTYQHVLITGLGRGGTTALAQVFQGLGFVFEQADEFMENKDYRRLLLSGDYSTLIAQLQAWQSSECRHAWKDPKLSSPVHHHAFYSALPDNIVLVAVLRDLVATTSRFISVDQADFFETLMRYSHIQKKLLQLVELQKSQRPVLLVSYEKLLLNSHSVVRQLAEVFNIDDAALINQATALVQVSPDHYRMACQQQINCQTAKR